MEKIFNETIIQSLLRAKVHLGFKQKYNKEIPFYILGYKKKSSIINLNFTYNGLKRAFYFLIEAISNFQTVLILSEKNSFLKYYCYYEAKNYAFFWDYNKWQDGFLTNFHTIFLDFKETKLELLEPSEIFSLRGLKHRPNILIVFDVNKYKDAINEAYKLNMPIIGIIDTNCEPTLLSKITYSIPGNISNVRSIFLFSKIFAKAIFLGRKKLNMKHKLLIRGKLNNQKLMLKQWKKKHSKIKKNNITYVVSK